MKKESIKNSIGIIGLSTVVPMFILSVAYYFKGIYPGGYYTVLTSDLGAQYMPFWASLRYLYHSDNSLFFNMSGALGNNFLGFLYYGILSPLTLLTVFFPLERLPEVLYALTIIRIGLCGGCFSIYLSYTYSEKQNKLLIFLLGCSYALMAYNIGYSMHLMWIDGVIFLPLILIGIELILKESNPLFFIISIVLSILCDYYISFMTAVFSIGYIIIRLKEVGKLDFKRIILFLRYALVAIGLSMPVIFPSILGLANGKLEENSKPIVALFRYDLLEILGQLLSGQYDTLFDDGLPLIFCGSGTIVFVLVYFFLVKEKCANKLMWLGFIVFYLFSMCYVPLDRAMHGFKETTFFEVRYSYVFSCLLLILAYKGGIYVYEKIENHTTKKVICVIFGFFVLTELFMNSSILIAGIKSELHYGTYSDYSWALNTKRELLDSIEDTDFYRISDYSAYTYNDGAWLGYNGIGYFSSCYNRSVMNFLGALGENHSYHILREQTWNPIEESLLGVKYRIHDTNCDIEGSIVTSNGLYSVRRNDYALSLGYMVNTNVVSASVLGRDAFDNQNTVAKELSGIDKNVFVELEQNNLEVDDNTGYAIHDMRTVQTTCEAPVWIFFENINDEVYYNMNKETKLLVNGIDIGGFADPNWGSAYVVYLGRYSEGEDICIEVFSNIYYDTCHVEYMDEEVYHEMVKKLGDNQLIVTKHRSGYYEGRIDANDGGYMLLSLPFMQGWILNVDGRRTEYDSYKDALIAVPLGGGEHTISIYFVSPGTVIGTCLCLISLCFFVRIVYCSKKRMNSNV